MASSDAFFPFPDGLQTLIDAGVRAVVHTGGSVRDDEVTAAAAAAGITLYLTGATALRALEILSSGHLSHEISQNLCDKWPVGARCA